MAFNPHEILLKIRNGQTKDVGFEEKLIEDKNNFSNQKNLGNFNEKKNYFASASSSSSFKTNNNKEITNENTNIIYDREYIESLLKNISLLENKVNKLEIELENANSQVKMLQIEKNELENLVLFFIFCFYFNKSLLKTKK